jgi:hypothetical protein
MSTPTLTIEVKSAGDELAVFLSRGRRTVAIAVIPDTINARAWLVELADALGRAPVDAGIYSATPILLDGKRLPS